MASVLLGVTAVVWLRIADTMERRRWIMGHVSAGLVGLLLTGAWASFFWIESHGSACIGPCE
jgi:hypothetical protein